MHKVAVTITRIEWRYPAERQNLPITYERFETYVNDPADEQELLSNILDGLFVEFEELVSDIEYHIL